MLDLAQHSWLVPVGIGAVTVAAAVYMRRKKEIPFTPAVDNNPMNPLNWEIGPIDTLGNASRGLPLHPLVSAAGFDVVMSTPEQQPHYVTMACGPLVGKTAIRLKLRLQLSSPWVQIGAVKDGRPIPGTPTVSLFIQRAGDDWSGKPYRFWAATTPLPLQKAGDYELYAELDPEHWTAVMSRGTPADFHLALAETARVGFTLGGPEGKGHGICAIDGAACLTVLDFKVE
jgi:hypothetical protein